MRADAIQRVFARDLRALMAKYPTAETAREARRQTDQDKPSAPHETRQEVALKGA